MASTTKKGSRKTKAKPRRPAVKKSQPKQAENIQSLRRERDELLAREAATSEILRMIARAPADLQSVLDAIAERAAKLCDAADAAVYRVDGDIFRCAAHFGPIPLSHAADEAALSIVARPRVERLSTARRSMSMTFEQPKLNFQVPRQVELQLVFARCSRHHCYAKVWPSALFIFADERSVLSRTGKSSCSKPSPIKR